MKKDLLTVEILHQLMHYDPQTGIFTNLVTRESKAKEGDVPGLADKDGYLEAAVFGRQRKLHRLAWLYMTGKWPTNTVYHINGIRSDNRFSNLRDVSRFVNQHNRRVPPKNNSTGFLGVSYVKSRKTYVAQICLNGKQKNLGRFKTAEEAYTVYLQTKRQIHEGNTL